MSQKVERGVDVWKQKEWSRLDNFKYERISQFGFNCGASIHGEIGWESHQDDEDGKLTQNQRPFLQ